MSDWLLTPLLIKADLIWAATDPDDPYMFPRVFSDEFGELPN